MGAIVPGDEHDAGGAAIEPVDDAGAFLAANRRPLFSSREQRVYERPSREPAPGCTTMPARLLSTTRSQSS